MGLYQTSKQDVLADLFVNLNDGSGTAITSTLTGGKQALDVNIAGGSTSAAVADKTTYVYGTTSFQAVGGVFQDTSPTLTAGQSGSFRLTANRAIHLNLRDASGNELGAANASGVFVRIGDGTNTGSFSATNEQFTQLRQGGNVGNITAANELKVIDTNGGLINGKMSPATATLTQVAITTSSQSALASNANRKGAILVNDGIAVVKVAFAATATTSAYTFKMQGNDTLELTESRVYTGAISFIGSVATGNLVITELT